MSLVFQLVFPLEEYDSYTRWEDREKKADQFINVPDTLQIKQLRHLEIIFGYYMASEVAGKGRRLLPSGTNWPDYNRGAKKGRPIEENEIWLPHKLTASVPEHRVKISLNVTKIRELAQETSQAIAKRKDAKEVPSYNLTYHAPQLPEGQFSDPITEKRRASVLAYEKARWGCQCR